MLLALIITPVLLYFVVLIPGVQNSMAHMLTQRLSEDLGSEVSIGNIRFHPIKKIIVNKLLVKDQQHDSLFYIEHLAAPIDSINFRSKQIYLGQITIAKLQTHLRSDSGTNNYAFVIDSLLKGKKSKSKWQFNIQEVRLNNSAVSYINPSAPQAKTKFNTNNIQVSSLNLHVDKIINAQQEISFRIKNFSAKEQSGLVIKSTKGQVNAGNQSFTLSNLLISGEHSFISLGKFNVQFDSTAQHNDFINGAPIELQINSLSADYRECQLFIPNFPKLQNRINIRGNFYGTIAELKGRNININAGNDTHLETSFDITGLPNFRESYIYLDVKNLTTNTEDITKIISISAKSESVDLPDALKQVGNIEYNGKFSGFVDNLVAYGSFKTDLGVIRTDIGIKLTKENKLIYSGFINTERFNVGKILKSESNLNNISMDVSVQGYTLGKREFKSYIKGTIDSIDIKGYKYEKIELNGMVSNNRFDGKINLNDPNIQLLFNGKVDFSDNIPEFDFSASLNNVKLDKLNIAPQLVGSNISIMLNSKLNGKSINSITGNTVLHKGKIWIDQKEYLLDSLLIQANQDQSHKEITINSDLIDARLAGNFNLSTIPKAIKQVLSIHLPSLFSVPTVETYSDQFTFDIKTKHLSELTRALTNKFNISDSSHIHGSFNSINKQLEINGNFNQIKYNSLSARKLDVNLSTNGNELSTALHSEVFGIANFIPLHHFMLSQKASGDSIDLELEWNDRNERANRGKIVTQTKVRKTQEGDLYTKINLLPSFITLRDSVWTIQDSEINLTPNGIRVNTFRVHHLNQEININGSLYDDKEGTLTTYFQNIDINQITSLLNLNRLTFNGLLNGTIELKDSHKQLIVSSQISLDNLNINDEEIGDMSIESKWSNLQNAILINTQIKKDALVPLSGIGYFKPSDKDFSFNFKLDSLPLGFVNMYTSKAIQNLKGTGSGDLRLLKTAYGLGLEGEVKVNRAKFDVDLLQCSFFVEDSVIITPESFTFKNMALTDSRGRTGRFDGSIRHHNFTNMYFDLYVHANNMLLLNTKEKDNPLYYGTVYADGDLAVTGSIYDLTLDINGATRRNTKFYIPISDEKESLDNNFIRFVSASDTIKNKVITEEEYKVQVSNYTLNMGVAITPDAQVQVIFNSAGGNVLRSWGKGAIQIQRNKEGEINFLGDYMAEKGDYLFSLENVVNKRFDINKGGTIVWEGDPYDANIDITATYKLKTSLQSLTRTNGSSGESSEISSRVPINCDLILSHRLSQPKINFNITAPTLERSTQNIIQEAISTEEELNRQVLSLLVLNKFYTPSYNSSGSDSKNTNLANAYTYELLSGQLSSLVSQMLDDVDVGISYRPEDEISSEQIEVALSTQIFNDRVTLNGNVEYGKLGRFGAPNQNSTNIVGDFDMDVKLNKSGSLRAKAYTHSNDDFSFDNSPTTQGVGLSYQEEFDTIGELITKYWNWITGKGKKEEELTIDEEQTGDKSKQTTMNDKKVKNPPTNKAPKE